VRIGVDATPLLGTRTGIGVYLQRLLEQFGSRPIDVIATAFTLRGARRLPAALPAGVARKSRPVPARVLRAAWQRSELPPVEWLCGRVDVFHGTNFVLPPMRRAAGVVSVHDLSFVRYPETVNADSLRYRQLVPRSVRRATVVCTLTEAMADEIVAEYRIDRDRIVVTPPGVDQSWFHAVPLDPAARTRLGLPERYVLAVGTLEPRKNLPLLVAAYHQVRRAEPGTPPLVLVGPPGWGPALQLGALPAGAVITTGFLDDATLRGVVAGATCLVFPSLYEGFGLPPVEALACGVAVVATDLPVTREVLGSAAELVPPADLDSLAQALHDRLADGANTREEAERRRDQARQWTWTRCAEATLAAYRLASR
jgi:glycosyltransferase involved in cell wall biosynthesis